MLIKIHKNRSVSSSGTWGTKNENNYEILNFEFPEELEEYNKRIVYYLGNQKVWDAIIDNKAILTNAITTQGSVKAYIWCTKSDEAFETDVDFRTQIFVMNFFENENADGIVPTPEQVDGFNTMLTAMNEKIEEINELETTIENAETQRQENEETRQNNENTRQENEQIRQEQEAERERRTDEAIGNIEDKTAEYNANAEAKTTAFNNNATQKVNDFNSNYTQKVNDFNTNASSKELAFNSNAETKTNEFNTNATNKTNAFNSNATEKTTTFNNNVSTKTSEFNTNASDKTTAFDNNASSKTSAFNTNAESKTNTFNDNATQKITDFNNNAQAKTDAFDEHTAEITADIEDLQQEVEELSENMPWNTTEQATEISVDDAAKYSKNKLELFGNTEQDNTKITYKCDGTETGDYYLTYDSTDYYFTMPTITEGDILVFNTTDLKLYLADTEITTESTGTGTNLTFIPSPNSDYPQPIHVVTGENTIGVQGKNLLYFPYSAYNWDGTSYINGSKIVIEGSAAIALSIRLASKYNINIAQNTTVTFSARIVDGKGFYEQSWAQVGFNIYYDDGSEEKHLVSFHGPAYKDKILSLTITTSKKVVAIAPVWGSSSIGKRGNFIIFGIQMEMGRNATEYMDGKKIQIYPINLGSIELCKIGDYQDKFVKDNGVWKIPNKIVKIDSYNGETITTPYISTTGGLDIGATIYYVGNAEYTITDETLISELDAIYEHLKLVKGTNNITVTAEDLAPYMKLTYMQDLPSKLDNLDSRLSLLE